MIDLIRRSAVPESVLKLACRGRLSLPLIENIEILVHLTSVPAFAWSARDTIAGFSDDQCAEVVRDVDCPREILSYFLRPENRRLSLIPELIANPSVPEAAIISLAATATQNESDVIVECARFVESESALKAAHDNVSFSTDAQVWVCAALGIEIAKLAEEAVAIESAETANKDEPDVVQSWIAEHKAEIESEEAKQEPFVLVEHPELTEATEEKEPERLSLLQKLSKMKVSERIKAAMLGSREERGVLVRDGSRLVSSAVLASPKVSEQEIESFASMKNVQESVLRDIARSRKFMKNYTVVKHLVNNPRTPIDISIPLVKMLTPNDLKVLMINKNVSDVVRRLALKFSEERRQR